MGMMPHPERATGPLMGSSDGLAVFSVDLGAAVAGMSNCDHSDWWRNTS